ncbi:hypothetical protein EZV73_05825 [Acidaminobacter sp. JC074]|uniref:hypothetical protein n=1 Tax=Acidaminobacter sp. JC074 TaxID=2530199 RepID=UPI001F0E6AF3|nr:hypothetical protein [Acidaminobacter sp. JC074]MCH4887077.1 hypothetical protein [Acidaminobacter sp. JC074]
MKKKSLVIGLFLIVIALSFYFYSYSVELSEDKLIELVKDYSGKDVRILKEVDYKRNHVVLFKTLSDLDWGITILDKGINGKYRLNYMMYSDSKYTIKKFIRGHHIDGTTIMASENKDDIVKMVNFHDHYGNIGMQAIDSGPFIMFIDHLIYKDNKEILFYTEDKVDIRDHDEEQGFYGRGNSTMMVYSSELPVQSFTLVLLIIGICLCIFSRVKKL